MGCALVPEPFARGFESPLDLLTERAAVNRQVLGSVFFFFPVTFYYARDI